MIKDQRGQFFSADLMGSIALITLAIMTTVSAYVTYSNTLREYSYEYEIRTVATSLADFITKHCGSVMVSASQAVPWTFEQGDIGNLVVPGLATYNTWEVRNYSNLLDGAKLEPDINSGVGLLLRDYVREIFKSDTTTPLFYAQIKIEYISPTLPAGYDDYYWNTLLQEDAIRLLGGNMPATPQEYFNKLIEIGKYSYKYTISRPVMVAVWVESPQGETLNYEGYMECAIPAVLTVEVVKL